jgi:hypothetical protein
MGFKNLFKKLEGVEKRLENDEYARIIQIEKLQQEVNNLPDSEDKRALELKLASLNKMLAVEAKKTANIHLANARKIKKSKSRFRR